MRCPGVRVEFDAVEADDTILPGLFGHVQRVVGGLHQLVAIGDPGMRPSGHAAAEGTSQRAARERERLRIGRR